MSLRYYISKYKYEIFIGLILLSSGLLKLYFATMYVTYTDEILSAFVAKAISHTGLPILPSNSIYPRAPLHHYLLSIPIGIWGIDYLPMRINSIIFSLSSVLAVYLLGLKISNRKVAISAALILSFSSLFNQFALSGRMYMAYGTFYILSLYFFYDGFIEGKVRSKWLAIVFMSATMLSSEAGFLLGFIFVFVLLIYRKTDWLKDRVFYVGFVVWLFLVWFILVYDVPGSFHAFTAQSGFHEPRVINAQMPLREIIGNLSYPWRALDRSLPLSMPFFGVMTIWVIRKGELRRHYPLIVLLPALILESFFEYGIQYRLIIALLPLYILAVCQFVETLSIESITWKLGIILKSKLKLVAIITVIYLFFTMSILLINKISNPSALIKYIYQAFGYHDSRLNENLKPAYNYIRSHVTANDVIIVTTVEYGLFFLGTDYDYYYLRQKRTDNTEFAKFVPFEKEREPYYGKPIIDSVEKLENLIETAQKTIWVVADHKADSYVGPEIKKFIDENFKIVFDDYKLNRTKVYRRNTQI